MNISPEDFQRAIANGTLIADPRGPLVEDLPDGGHRIVMRYVWRDPMPTLVLDVIVGVGVGVDNATDTTLDEEAELRGIHRQSED